MKNKFIFLALVQCSFLFAQLPKEFVYVEDVIPSIKVDLRYFSNNNFLGKPIDSYKKEVAILTVQAAEALKNVQDELKQPEDFQENESLNDCLMIISTQDCRIAKVSVDKNLLISELNATINFVNKEYET